MRMRTDDKLLQTVDSVDRLHKVGLYIRWSEVLD